MSASFEPAGGSRRLLRRVKVDEMSDTREGKWEVA